MKIKTITCHDVYNAGASLQAYALSEYLKDFGDVEIIDYKPDYLSGHYKLTAVSDRFNKPLIRLLYIAAKLPSRIISLKRKKAFDKFTKRLPLTKRYNSLKELIEDPPTADLYICGSDQIWNTGLPNGKDEAFYLSFVKDGVKASFSASFAADSVADEFKTMIKKNLLGFTEIAVRESSGLNILKELGLNGVVTVDPVFLIDSARWKDIANGTKLNKKLQNKKYVFVYDFDGNDKIKELAIKLKKEEGLKIYSIFKNGYIDKRFAYAGPEEFLSLILNAKYVLSNSFHATAFSVIFEKEFYVGNRKENLNSRMRDLLISLNLENRLIGDSISFDNIDYDGVKVLLDEKIQESKDYLLNLTEKEN